MSEPMNPFNFFSWPPRLQGFVLGVALMTLAAVLDSLLFRYRCQP